MNRLQANLLLTAIAIVWASAFVAQAEGMKTMGPVAFTGIRFLLGALVVLPLHGLCTPTLHTSLCTLVPHSLLLVQFVLVSMACSHSLRARL